MQLLTAIEVRILGSLIEKELTTPEYYPLSANALTNACNQKNNRDPVVSYDEILVSNEVENMKDKLLVGKVMGTGSRVPKYRHLMPNFYHLDEREIPVMGVLMLRGAQTLGEIRSRTAPMKEFSSLEEVEQILENLSKRENPFVTKLPKMPGQKDFRYVHLLSGMPDIDAMMMEAKSESVNEKDRIAVLEQEVNNLKTEIENLKNQFGDFRKQFE